MNKEKNFITTTDLSDFGYIERVALLRLINAWHNQGLPDDFCNDEVVPMFDKNNGWVFLTNSEYQICILNGDKLKTWYNCPNCCHEGFAEDCQLNTDGCECCNPTKKEGEE